MGYLVCYIPKENVENTIGTFLLFNHDERVRKLTFIYVVAQLLTNFYPFKKRMIKTITTMQGTEAHFSLLEE